MKRLIVPTTLLTLLALATLAPRVWAQDAVENPDVTIEVDGLACPFCAYGVEKKLKQIDGVEALDVKIDEGRVEIELEEGATVTEDAIREAVADAGFTVRSITWADGRTSAATSMGGPPAMNDPPSSTVVAAAPDVVVHVEGMACQMCARSMTNEMKKLGGIEEVEVLLEEDQRVLLTLQEGATVAEEAFREAVTNAGFTTRSVEFARR